MKKCSGGSESPPDEDLPLFVIDATIAYTGPNGSENHRYNELDMFRGNWPETVHVHLKQSSSAALDLEASFAEKEQLLETFYGTNSSSRAFPFEEVTFPALKRDYNFGLVMWALLASNMLNANLANGWTVLMLTACCVGAALVTKYLGGFDTLEIKWWQLSTQKKIQ